MTKVCVIGGGTAGMEAAREVAAAGGEVMVVERSKGPKIPWKRWPELIPKVRPSEGRRLASRTAGVANILAPIEVRSIVPGAANTADGRKLCAERIIVATGSGFEPNIMPGSGKPGVITLDGPGKYVELGMALGAVSVAVVQGEGQRSLAVAERLGGGGRKVRLLISSWQDEEPSPPILAVLSQAAEEQGISIAKGRVDRAVGWGALEGVITAGKVAPCDTLVLVPRRVPNTVLMPEGPGRLGGISVDMSMRTGVHGVYAAGGCAELEAGLPPSATLGGEAASSGRIAGANSMGQNLAIGLARFMEVVVFGLRWLRVGVGHTSSRSLGTKVGVVGRRWDSSSACTIFYDERSGKVVGLETVEEATSLSHEILSVVSGSASLRTMAYGGASGSSDISLVSDTARLGLRSWSRY
jgi:NADPH-dependent 2,4-dienoyl-CoA reductase/sulfur reductase-like enzyme